MTTSTTTETTAARAVAAFEQLALGQPWADPARAAATAVRELYERLAEDLFPHTLAPADSGALVDFQIEAAEIRPLHAAADLSALFARAYPALRDVVVGPRGMRLLRNCAASVAPVLAKREPDAVAEMVEHFQTLVAQQLAEHGNSRAQALLNAVAMRHAVAAITVRHEAHAQAETERIERETRAAADAVEAAERAQREELAAFFSARHGLPHYIGGAIVSGQALAAIARRQGARDQGGENVTFSIAELEKARDRVTAEVRA